MGKSRRTCPILTSDRASCLRKYSGRKQRIAPIETQWPKVDDMSALFYTEIDDSPVGPLLLAGESEALHVLAFGVDPAHARSTPTGSRIQRACSRMSARN